jgi:hypothetical protein
MHAQEDEGESSKTRENASLMWCRNIDQIHEHTKSN